LFIIRLIGLTH